jgi:NAD+ synthase (glutamine-hydrolysing)
MIAVNGRIVAQGTQFSLQDVEVVTASIDIEDVRSYRGKISRNMQASGAERYHRIEVPFTLTSGKFELHSDFVALTAERDFIVRYHRPEEEIA